MFTSKKMIGMLFAGSAIVLPLALSSTPAIAGNVCDMDGGVALPNSASGTNATACGAAATANGDGSVALGDGAVSNGTSSIAIGGLALAQDPHALVISTSDTLNGSAAGQEAISIGDTVKVSQFGTGMGNTVTVSNGAAVGIGGFVSADGQGDIPSARISVRLLVISRQHHIAAAR